MTKRIQYLVALVASVFLLSSCQSDNQKESQVTKAHNVQRAKLEKEKQEKAAKMMQLSEEAKDNFYYQQLDSKSDREAYILLSYGLSEFESYIELPELSEESEYRVYTSVANDYPEFYWMSEALRDGLYTPEIVSPTYPVYVRETYRLLQSIGDQIVNQLPQGSDYDKVKYIYEYIINQTDYNVAALTDDAESWKGQGIKSVLVDKLSVCAGYSRTFQFLCEKAGIKSIYVTGVIEGSPYENNSHAWNLVEIDGQYYGIDATWGDPIFEGEMNEQVSSSINYNYLCVPEQILHISHKPDKDLLDFWGDYYHSIQELDYPAFTDNSLNYFVLNGSYFESFDTAAISNLIVNRASDPSVQQIEMQFATKQALDQMVAEAGREGNFIFQAFDSVFGFTETYEYEWEDHTYTFRIKNWR